MNWLQKASTQIRKMARNAAYPIAAIWTDKIIDSIELQTKYYGKVSFPLRKERNSGEKYLVIGFRGPGDFVWISLTNANANEIKTFLEEKFSVYP